MPQVNFSVNSWKQLAQSRQCHPQLTNHFQTSNFLHFFSQNFWKKISNFFIYKSFEKKSEKKNNKWKGIINIVILVVSAPPIKAPILFGTFLLVWQLETTCFSLTCVEKTGLHSSSKENLLKHKSNSVLVQVDAGPRILFWACLEKICI